MAGRDSTGEAMRHQADGAIKAGWAQTQGQEAVTLMSKRDDQICLHLGTLSSGNHKSRP